MIKKLLITMIMSLCVCFSACTANANIDINQLSLDEVTIDYQPWFEQCEPNNGYYQHIVTDPDSWETIIYYPQINDGNYIVYNVTVTYKDNTLEVFIDEENAVNDNQVQYDLMVHISVPTRGAFPTETIVYLNNEEIDILDLKIVD